MNGASLAIEYSQGSKCTNDKNWKYTLFGICATIDEQQFDPKSEKSLPFTKMGNCTV